MTGAPGSSWSGSQTSAEPTPGVVPLRYVRYAIRTFVAPVEGVTPETPALVNALVKSETDAVPSMAQRTIAPRRASVIAGKLEGVTYTSLTLSLQAMATPAGPRAASAEASGGAVEEGEVGEELLEQPHKKTNTRERRFIVDS
jgi:hypothetical protein